MIFFNFSRKNKKINNPNNPNNPNNSGQLETYFEGAKSWADDRFLWLEVSRQRYQVAFFSMLILVGLLSLSLLKLLPLKTIQLAVIHEGVGGAVWVSALSAGDIPKANWAKTSQEIAHYVEIRESYDPILYHYFLRELRVFSSDLVMDGYLALQDQKDSLAPVNFLGTKGYRTVEVKSVVPLDLESKNNAKEQGHINLAQVTFVTTDHYFDFSGAMSNETENSATDDGAEGTNGPAGTNNMMSAQTLGSADKTAYTVLVSWAYTGVPQDPSLILEDWDGFLITKYQRQMMA